MSSLRTHVIDKTIIYSMRFLIDVESFVSGLGLGFLQISTIKYITNLYKNIKFDKVIYLIIKMGKI